MIAGQESPLRTLHWRLFFPVLMGLAVGYLYFNRIQRAFFEGAYVDLAVYAHLAHARTAFSNDPLTFFPPLFGYFGNHFHPIFFLFVIPSYFLPVSIVDNISLLFAAQSVVIVLSVAVAVLSLRLKLPDHLASGLASLTGLALYFSAPNLAAMGYPHFEALFPPLAVLFFLAYAVGRPIAASVMLILLLLIREDMGIHLSFIVFGLVILELVWGNTPWKKLRLLSFFGVIALLYSFVSFWIQIHFFPGHSQIPHYINNPIFSHVTKQFIIYRVTVFFEQRSYLLVAFVLTSVIAFIYRRPQYLLGYIVYIPWLILNLLAVKNEAGTLETYHGYPFILALIWPVVYEVLKVRCFDGEEGFGSPADVSAASYGFVRTAPVRRALADQRTQIVMATIMICVCTTLLAPRSIKVFNWSELAPESAKRQATLLLMDFLAQDQHHRLGLRVSRSVAAIGSIEIKRKDVIRKEKRPSSSDGVNGAILFAGRRDASDAIPYAISEGFGESVRLGVSNIYVVFRGEHKDGIVSALRAANAGGVPLIEENFPDSVSSASAPKRRLH